MGFQDLLDDIGTTIEGAAMEGRNSLNLVEEEHVLRLTQEALKQYVYEGWLEQ